MLWKVKTVPNSTVLDSATCPFKCWHMALVCLLPKAMWGSVPQTCPSVAHQFLVWRMSNCLLPCLTFYIIKGLLGMLFLCPHAYLWDQCYLGYVVPGFWSPKQRWAWAPSHWMNEPYVRLDSGWLRPPAFCQGRPSMPCRQESIVDQRVCAWLVRHAFLLL